MTFEERVRASIGEMANKCKYHPTGFIGMIDKYGTHKAVKMLINGSQFSDGYVKLWERGHLELSMESIIQEDAWKDLFTNEEREKARKRLLACGYNVNKY